MKKPNRIYVFLALFAFVFNFSSAEIRWAYRVRDYSSERTFKAYSSTQVLGKPSVMPDFGPSMCAWSPKPSYANKTEFVEVEFKEPIFASRAAVYMNAPAPLNVKIYLVDSLKRYRLVKSDFVGVPSEKLKMLVYDFEKTDYRVFGAKISISANFKGTMFQVDAVAVSDSNEAIEPKINLGMTADIKISPENLGPRVNSYAAELAPIITADGSTLYFTRDDHSENLGAADRQDIWVSEIGEDDSFGSAKNLGQPLNNELPNFAISVSSDGNALYVGSIYHKDGTSSKGLSRTEKTVSGWSYPDAVTIRNYENRSGHVNFQIVSGEKIMTLACEDRKSIGDLDLYVSFLQEDGSWSEPLNLGPDINTASQEGSPFLAGDLKTLYFSSRGRPGYGSNDMFVSKRLDESWTNWSEPMNLGPQYNGPGWDAYYVIPASGDRAYFVSDRDDPGNLDIYRIELPEELRPNPVALVKGKVLNAKTEKPLAANIIYEILPGGEKVGTATSNPVTGDYRIQLPTGEKYGFLAEASGFVAINENLDLSNLREYREVERDLYLAPIEKGQKIVLNNIFFEFAKYELLEDSFSELNRVASFLKNNPEVEIEIRGHTDNVGSDASNMLLSRRRAESVADYLTEKGISADRLSVKGFGESEPIVPNDTEENRFKNRRVEFVIK